MSQRVKATNVSDVSLLTAQYGPSEGAMDHWGLVLWGKMPFLDFPYAQLLF